VSVKLPVWGIQKVRLPHGALACWGARAAVSKDGRWQIREERQDMTGPAEKRVELARLMNEGGALRAAEETERSLYIDRKVPFGSVVCVVDRPRLVVLTRFIGGYVYVTAYMRRARS